MSKIRVIGNKLVPVYETDTGKKFVYGTELHAVLEVKSNYTTWINRRFSECDAIENEDYQTCFPKLESENHGGQNKKEHIIKLDTAKEMAMLERNDIGKQVRKYFIEIEKKYEQAKADRQQLSPTLQVVYALADSQAEMELEQKRQAEQIAQVETKVETMKEIFTKPISNWRAEINSSVRKISIKSGIEFQLLYNKMYRELECTAHCNLKIRCSNKQVSMRNAGKLKSAIKEETTRIAIIEEDPKLKIIFEDIVRRYEMSYCV